MFRKVPDFYKCVNCHREQYSNTICRGCLGERFVETDYRIDEKERVRKDQKYANELKAFRVRFRSGSFFALNFSELKSNYIDEEIVITDRESEIEDKLQIKTLRKYDNRVTGKESCWITSIEEIPMDKVKVGELSVTEMMQIMQRSGSE